MTRNPWYADEYLRETFNLFIEGSESLVKTIANSPDVRKMFERRVELMTHSSEVVVRRIRDLQAAKQRFQSTQKPLGRFILYFPALCATAYELQTRRGDSSVGQRGTKFLEIIDEERFLTLAMLADAGDEAAMTVRFFDSKDHDIADAPHVLSAFLQRVNALFLDRRGCLSPVEFSDGQCHTYTSYALDMLRSEARVLTLQQGRQAVTRSVGGPSSVSDELLERCLGRMAAWVRLAAATVRAEFPDWEVLNAFAAFSLKLKGGANNKFITDSLNRLSAVFDVDPQCLRSQFVDFRLTACTHHERGMDNFSAWRASVQAVATSSGQVQARHPRQALDKVLARYGAFLGASTSNVERSFAALLDAAGSRRSRLSTINMSNDLRLRLLEKNRPYEPLVDAARRIWSESFGMSRRSGKDRRRRWVAGVGKQTKPTLEKDFIDKRRSAVNLLVTPTRKQTLAELELSAEKLSAGVWSEGHEKAAVQLWRELLQKEGAARVRESDS